MNVSAMQNTFNTFNNKEQRFPMMDTGNQPLSPPDLLHDSEEDDEDSLCTPSLSLSPKQGYKDQDLLSSHNINKRNEPNMGRRKSVPHKSPAAIQDTLQASLFDKSIVFQLDASTPLSDDLKCTSKIICGQSLLTSLRKRVAHARSQHVEEPVIRVPRRKRMRTASIIEIPRSQHRRTSSSSDQSDYSSSPIIVAPKARKWADHPYQDQPKPSTTTHVRRQSNNGTSSGRPSRVKGPCQACQEPADGCMRKAFNWPFPTNQTFNDKGKPFVYLCNKCGLRYNKSGGCVCRNCRWVFCKEEKRKAIQHIDAMRRKRPNGYVDPNEYIENFVCSPKYWACGKPWKVGWVLNNLDEDEEDSLISSPNHTF